MRRILSDSAVAHGAQKRGGGAAVVALDEALDFSAECSLSLAGVDEAPRSLEALDPRQGKIVELRFFGLTIEEVAEVLQISPATEAGMGHGEALAPAPTLRRSRLIFPAR